MSSTTSRIVRLTALPDGLPQPEHFTVEQAPMPVQDDGEVLVRDRFFQVFPSLRTLIGGGVEGTPFPALRPGDALFGAAIGEVVRGCADRLHLLDGDGPTCAAQSNGTARRRLAALDAEIARLTLLRDTLAAELDV